MADDSGVFEGDRVTGMMICSGRMRIALRAAALADFVERQGTSRPPPPMDEDDPETLDIEPDPPSAA